MSKHRSTVDWLSVSIDAPALSGSIDDDAIAVHKAIQAMPNLRLMCAGTPEHANGIRPFRRAIRYSGGAMVMWDNFLTGETGRVYVQLNGSSCALLPSENWPAFLRRVANDTSRLDIALDIQTDVKPEQFVERMGRKARTRATVHSQYGDTEYVGSRQSDRFVRVYRYNPPHPRAEFLRVEYELKGDTAKGAAWAVCENGVEQACADYGGHYDWQHECYPDDLTDKANRLEPVRPDGKRGNTVMWLLTKVAPSLRKVVESGELELVEFLDAAGLTQQ